MKVLHGLMSQPNITTSMIYQNLECREDQTKHLTEQGDVGPTDGEDEQSLSGQCNQGTPL